MHGRPDRAARHGIEYTEIDHAYVVPRAAEAYEQLEKEGLVMKHINDHGAKKGTKIAYLHHDNPLGRDGISVVEEVARREGYVLRLFAVPGDEVAGGRHRARLRGRRSGPDHGLPLTDDQVRRGYESIRELALQGLGSPLCPVSRPTFDPRAGEGPTATDDRRARRIPRPRAAILARPSRRPRSGRR